MQKIPRNINTRLILYFSLMSFSPSLDLGIHILRANLLQSYYLRPYNVRGDRAPRSPTECVNLVKLGYGGLVSDSTQLLKLLQLLQK